MNKWALITGVCFIGCLGMSQAQNESISDKEYLVPLKVQLKQDTGKILVGKKLFSDPILSADQKFACQSCHQLGKYGVDNKSKSMGKNRTPLKFHTPSVYNSHLNFRQFWNGRATNLSMLLDEHIADTQHMHSFWPEISERLIEKEIWKTKFESAFDDGLTPANIKTALLLYLYSLNTPNSKMDQYLLGDDHALNEEEKKGFELFKRRGCISCHQGINIGGNIFQKLGIYRDYYSGQKTPHPSDMGRYQVTSNEEDKYVFKVPSLRNVAQTAPYYHDGSIETLEETVESEALYQLGHKLLPYERDLIIQFLNALTGELPRE